MRSGQRPEGRRDRPKLLLVASKHADLVDGNSSFPLTLSTLGSRSKFHLPVLFRNIWFECTSHAPSSQFEDHNQADIPPLSRTDPPKNAPWPHQDQDPLLPGFRCLQGLVNLLPNGPKDGGLIVCKGAHRLSERFHEEMKDEPKIPAWTNEWFGFTENGMKWLADQGCTWEKVCAEPGDLLLWDSRTPHYNLGSETSQPRFCIYTCFMPVAHASQEDLLRKKDALERWVGTTHWPNARHTGSNLAKRDGEDDPHNRMEPVNKPAFTERSYKLTGIPYIKVDGGLDAVTESAARA